MIAYLVEPDVVTEVGVTVQLDVTTIRCPLTLTITSENVDDAVLNLFGDVCEVHVIPTASRAFYLDLVSVVLVESLERLYQEEVYSQPCA